MFRALTIQGLRGVKKLRLNDFQKINLLVGKNNCGKTTILESIFLLIGATNARLPLSTNAFRGGFNIIDDNSWRLFFHKLNVNTDIFLTGELKQPIGKRTLKIRPHVVSTLSTNSTKTRLDKDMFNIEDSYSGTSSIIDGLVLELSLTRGKNTKLKKITTKIIVKEITSKKGSEVVLDLDSPTNYKEDMKGVFLNSRTVSFGREASTRFNNIQIKKQVKEIIEVLRHIEPNLKSLTLSKDGVVYCDIGLDQLLPINVMGDGMFRLFSIIVTIFDTQNGIVLIDEIENGFHHSSQKILWNSIMKAAKEFNVQIIATTHSMECVRAFNSVSSGSSEKNKSRLFRIEKVKDEINVISYDNKVLTSTLESNWEVR